MNRDDDTPEKTSEDASIPTYAVGYARPPVEHRFKKKQSGNPKGRPPKEVRSLMPSQMRRDYIRAGEKPMRVRTSKGIRTMTVVESVIMQMAKKAINGDGPSMRRFLDQYDRAVREHHELNKDVHSFYEMIEREWMSERDEASARETLKMLYRFFASSMKRY